MTTSATTLVLNAIREGLVLVLLLSAPPLIASMVTGFVVGLFQAATQIQDQTLAFVPKLVVVLVVLVAMGMHMLSPTTVSLPFKLLLFVIADGWTLVIRGLLMSYA